MSKPKVLYFIYSTDFAGTEKQLFNLCKGIQNSFDITIICPSESLINKEFKCLNIKITNYKFNLKEIFDIATFIRKEKFNIIHNYLGKAELIGTLAGVLARNTNIITTKHFIKSNYMFKSKIIKYLSLMGHIIINYFNKKIICVSNSVRGVIVEMEKVNPKKVVTIYNGSDFLKRDPIMSNGFIIGTLSRLSAEKGLMTLIEAMNIIKPKYPQALCCIAGNGPLENDLKVYVNKLSLNNSIKFLGYVCDAVSFIDSIDIFVYPSLWDSFGIGIVEAQMRGKPVIAVNSGGPGEIIIDGKTGILIEPSQADVLANAIDKLFSERKLAYNLAVQGQKKAIAHFTSSEMCIKTKKLYESLLGL